MNMKDLRYVIKETPFGYVGKCLELGLMVRDKDFDECYNKICQLAYDYLESADRLEREGHTVICKPVKHYWLRKMRFDIDELLRAMGFEKG